MDDAIAKLGSEPISVDAPTGISIRYEPEFEQLQAEIDKLESVNAVPVNWGEVVEVGARILDKKSKDLLVACYMCHGLFDRNGFEGLTNGLTILSDLITTYWDTLFPELKRQRARVAALEWLVERLAPQVTVRKPGSTERDAVKSCKLLVEQLDEVLKNKLGEQAIAWGELYRPLRDYEADFSREEERKQKAKEEARKEPAPMQTPAQPAGVAAVLSPSTTEILSDQDANKALRSCQDILRKVATYVRGKNLADPFPYRLLRMSTWLDVELPPVQGNLTQIRQIPADRLDFFNQQLQAGNHALLINEVESSFGNAPFWLDAHRFTAMALESLGHMDAQRAVICDLAAFLRRFPKLLEFQFMGGKPFADDQTRLWIETNVLTGPDAGSGLSTPSAAGTTENTLWLELSREARQFAVKGKFREGVNVFQERRRQAVSRRDRFLCDLHQARFCQEAGYVEVAIPQLESLDEEGERYHLEEWEPDLSLQIAALLLVCYTKTQVNNELSAARTARVERMRSRVSRLDAAMAFDLITKTK
jgi:type VI secretion system protein VasJ